MTSRFYLPCLAISLVLAIASSGCRSTSVTTATPITETSAKPGINDEYLKPDINVTQWVERLEREGREIFTQREDIIKAAKIRRGSTVADIGAGTGLFTPLLSQAVGPNGTVYAVDIVKSFLTLIEKRATEAGVRNVKTVLCTERSVELPANSIDTAFICDVYHHFEYPQSSLASLHRALKPKGEVVLIDFKRIPGQSSDWILNHVRAGQEVVTAELEQAGFKQVEQVEMLKENYFLRFRKVSR